VISADELWHAPCIIDLATRLLGPPDLDERTSHVRTLVTLPCATLLAAALVLPSLAAAQDPPPPPPPAPYSLPWQLRPAAVANVVRSDTAIAMYEPEDAGSGGTTIASTLLASYKVTPEIAPLIRLGVVSNSPPEIGGVTADSGFGFLNPILGGTWAFALAPNLKLALFLGVAIPIGSGGGNDPDLANRKALVPAGILARSAMDNAMFAMNYFTVFPGVDFAFVQSGFTAQAEVTFLQLTRIRGDDIDADSSRSNLTMGLHLGYFIIPALSVGADLRYQRWLASKTFLDDDNDTNDDTASFAVGPRLHLKLSDTMWLRPGLAYARGIDDPMSADSYNILQIDVPVSF
jgi:hypothetical protein